ncbi:MAG TPA: sugar phosphate isomerase/epimerase family protein, partial [Methanomicrobiales archaeon]|nr:sugar phosphate isomerase/epimerase family protein [Methanomicrobiales archaeon]
WVRNLPVGELLECIADNPGLAPITVHAPILDLNPCSINPGVAEVSRRDITRAIEIAEQAGASVVTVHPGRRTAKRTPSAPDYERFERLIAMLRDASHKSGITISIENMEPKVNSLLCTPEDTRDLLDREPWLSFTLDTSHALVKDLETLLTYIDLCHDRITNIHISRVENGRMHLPIHGDPTMAAILERLADLHYSRYLTLEIEDLNLGYEASAEDKVILLERELRFMREHIS